MSFYDKNLALNKIIIKYHNKYDEIYIVDDGTIEKWKNEIYKENFTFFLVEEFSLEDSSLLVSLRVFLEASLATGVLASSFGEVFFKSSVIPS